MLIGKNRSGGEPATIGVARYNTSLWGELSTANAESASSAAGGIAAQSVVRSGRQLPRPNGDRGRLRLGKYGVLRPANSAQADNLLQLGGPGWPASLPTTAGRGVSIWPIRLPEVAPAGRFFAVPFPPSGHSSLRRCPHRRPPHAAFPRVILRRTCRHRCDGGRDARSARPAA